MEFTIEDARMIVLDLVRAEAHRGQSWLRKNPRVIGKRLEKRVRPSLRDEFFTELHLVLGVAGYPNLSALVREEVSHYFALVRQGGVEPRFSRVTF